MKSIDHLGLFGSCQTSYDAFNNSNTLSLNFSLLPKEIAWKIWPTALVLKNVLLVINFPIYSLISLFKKEIKFIWYDFSEMNSCWLLMICFNSVKRAAQSL